MPPASSNTVFVGSPGAPVAAGAGDLRALALDVDGTLLDPSHAIAPEVKAALLRARAHGIAVMLASGRHLGSLAGIARQLEIEAWVVGFAGGGGAYVKADGSLEVAFLHTLPQALAARVLARARADGLDATFYAIDCWYAPSLEGWYRKEAGILREEPVLLPRIEEVPIAPCKLQLIGHGERGHARLQQARAELEGQAYCVMSYSHSNILEVMPPSVSKATGLAELAPFTGVGLEQMVAFGDADNDLEMLRAVGLGVAMGNGSAEVKAAADWVTASNAEQGVAYALAQDWLWQRLLAGAAEQGPGNVPP